MTGRTIQTLSEPANGSGAVAHDQTAIDTRSAAKPAPLDGVSVPTRNRTIRRRVYALYSTCSWLTGADVGAAVRWATLTEKFRRLSEMLDRLPEGGTVKVSKGDLEPRKALAELRALSSEITKLETALGITASARAALGVNITRGLDLAQQMARSDGRYIEGRGE